MKVKLKSRMYQRPGKLWEVYCPGDIFDVPTSQFFPDIMEKIEEPKKEEQVINKEDVGSIEDILKEPEKQESLGDGVPPSAVETEVTVTHEEPPVELVSEEPKKTRRRKRS